MTKRKYQIMLVICMSLSIMVDIYGYNSILTSSAKTSTYTVKFYSNGGAGKMSSQKIKYGETTILKTCEFHKKGYTIEGWSKKKNGKVYYTENAVIKNLTKKGKTIKLYVKWKKVGKRRALVLGETSTPQVPYEDVESMKSMLKKCKMYGEKFKAVEVFSDKKKKEIVARIQKFFIDTSKNDVSYIYITCHGNDDGSIIIGSDEEGFTTEELRNLLDHSIKGTIVLLLDYCYSGNAIESYTADELVMDFTKKEGNEKNGEFASARYKVLCSSHYYESSKIISAVSLATDYWERGAGWNGNGGATCPLEADENNDKKITLSELYEYSNKNVVKDSNQEQHVVVYPKTSDFVIFGKFN